MKLIGWILLAALVIAAAQAVAAVLVVALLVALICGLFVAPRETFGLVALSILIGLFTTQPLACLGIIGLLLFVRLFKKDG